MSNLDFLYQDRDDIDKNETQIICEVTKAIT